MVNNMLELRMRALVYKGRERMGMLCYHEIAVK